MPWVRKLPFVIRKRKKGALPHFYKLQRRLLADYKIVRVPLGTTPSRGSFSKNEVKVV